MALATAPKRGFLLSEASYACQPVWHSAGRRALESQVVANQSLGENSGKLNWVKVLDLCQSSMRQRSDERPLFPVSVKLEEPQQNKAPQL